MENGTIKLLRECNEGIKMGVASIDEVLPAVKSDRLKNLLNACKDKHAELGNETHRMLLSYGAEDKEPSVLAKSMSWFKTNFKLAVECSDAAIADLMTDGCNMGIKNLNRYMNQYENASEESRCITKRLIDMEQELVHDIRVFL